MTNKPSASTALKSISNVHAGRSCVGNIADAGLLMRVSSIFIYRTTRILLEERSSKVIGPRPLISCCEAAWIRVDLFSGMLQSSKYGVSREFSWRMIA
nr:hypothetical protein [Tanacetum cinerariifolium]